MTDTKMNDCYDGNWPYLFVSYSHKDQNEMDSVKRLLDKHKIRYWYDNGLHSGDDWNLKIATHLKNSTVCLLLLSPNSAESEYVKNELNFARNHRIPIHILLLYQFELPIDIEMMTGRIQMVEMTGEYHKKFINSLPGEVFINFDSAILNEIHRNHPLFIVGDLRSDRQGTKVYDGIHKRLSYKCAIVEDVLQKDQIEETKELIANVCSISHPIFPVIYDINFDGQNMLAYQEFYGGKFLDEYLEEHVLDQDTIIRWIKSVVEGIGYLYKKRFVFRDFARGSLIVDMHNNLRFFRLYNPYYGVVKLNEETKQYYFEKSLQEIAIFLAQLCIGKEPMLPIRIVETERFEQKFLTKINVIIQKCTKENGKIQYNSFEEILLDLEQKNTRIQELLFLKKRKKKLKDYDDARKQIKEREQFISMDIINQRETTQCLSIEEEFGFEGTILLTDQTNDDQYKISILVCSTGRIYNFDKDEILVGRGNMCDIVWTQPAISRMHVKIRYYDSTSYLVTDLNTTNGSYVSGLQQVSQLKSGVNTIVSKGSIIRIGDSEMRLL